MRADEARAEAVLTRRSSITQRSTKFLAAKTVAQADVDKTAEALHVAEADLKRSHASHRGSRGADRGRREKSALPQGASRVHRNAQPLRRTRHPPRPRPRRCVVPGASIPADRRHDEIWVCAWVDETAMPALATDQPARVVFRSEPGRELSGEGVAARPRDGPRDARVPRGCAREGTAEELDDWPARRGVHRNRHESPMPCCCRPAFSRGAAQAGVFVNDQRQGAVARRSRSGLRGIENVAKSRKGLPPANKSCARPMARSTRSPTANASSCQ